MFGGKAYLGKATIREGAIYGQDHGMHRWGNNKIIFEVYDFNKSRKDLIADGYGRLEKPNCYGNGSLYVKNEDIEWVDLPEEMVYERELSEWLRFDLPLQRGD